jgi:hypothetical protein
MKGAVRFPPKVRFGTVPACRGHHGIFRLATCYAALNGRVRPGTAIADFSLQRKIACESQDGRYMQIATAAFFR